MIIHTKGLTEALRRSLNSGQQESFVTHSRSSKLHRCLLFLEHYIPKPYLHQKHFPKAMQPSRSSETWDNLVGSGLSELRLFQLQKASSTDNSDPAFPKSITSPLLKRLTNPYSSFCIFLYLLIHSSIFNIQGDIFQFKCLINYFSHHLTFTSQDFPTEPTSLGELEKCMMRDLKNSYFKLSFKQRNIYPEIK